MISVAMALYNSTRFIEEQLDSIRKQTIPVDEVIMIDDCSSDGTIEMVDEYIQKFNLSNWRLLSHEENKGYIETFCDAIGACRGDIIILCDHDDVWYPDKVQIISSLFKKKPEVLMLVTSFDQIDENGRVLQIKQKRNHANNNLIRRKVKKGKLNKMNIYDVAIYNLSPGCTCAIRTSIKKEFLQNRCALPHDWTLSILAACNNGLYYYDKTTIKYRIHTNNTIGLGHENRFENRKKIVKRNMLEKKAALRIVEEKKGTSSAEYQLFKKIKDIFEIREQAMVKRQIRLVIKALIYSVGIDHLYESILMDLLTLISKK